MKVSFIGKTILIDNDGERILVVGDLHLGFSESMRESGYAVPVKIYDEIIGEFDSVFEHIKKKYGNYHNTSVGVEGEMGGKERGKKDDVQGVNGKRGDIVDGEFDLKKGVVDKIILLGDLKHEFGRIMRDEWNEIGNFIDYLSGKLRKGGKIVILKGNHDVMTGFVTRKKNIEIVDYYLLGDCAFVHGDRDFDAIYDSEVKKWFMGHGHPAITIGDETGIKKEKYKCFLTGKWKGREVFILPSFFDVNEGTDIRGLDGEDMGFAWNFNLGNFEVFVVEGGTLNVLNFGKLKEIN